MKEFIEKLIERLEELKEASINEDCPIVPNSEDCEMEYSCASCYLNAVIKFVNELAEEYATDTNGGKWIPCSERMPEEESNVIITTKAGNVMVGMYTKKYGQRMSEGFICDDYFVYMCSVVAWMPLPEPYKPTEPKEIPSNHYMERFSKVI